MRSWLHACSRPSSSAPRPGSPSRPPQRCRRASPMFRSPGRWTNPWARAGSGCLAAAGPRAVRRTAHRARAHDPGRRSGHHVLIRNLPDVVAPIASYNHTDGVVVISGGVYRRPASGNVRCPLEYDGNYFFLDHYSGFMRRLTGSGNAWTAATAVPGQPSATDWASGMENVSNILAMPDGSLLYVRQSENSVALTAEIRRIAVLAAGSHGAHGMATMRTAPPSRRASTSRNSKSWGKSAALASCFYADGTLTPCPP